jgi:poly(3-hydroxybutyrate) depolymerase
MPYTLLYDGVVREFDFYAPPGWQHWVGEAWKQGRRGLPLVVALHGGGQDPLVFQEDWFFPRVWKLGLDDAGNPGEAVIPGTNRFLDNQFFVLYPYGQGWMTKSLYELAYGLVEPPAIPKLPSILQLPVDPDLPKKLADFEGWLNLLASSMDSLHGADLRSVYRDSRTMRAFDPGFGGSGPLVDDVGFIKAAQAAMDDKLRQQIGEAAADLPDDFPLEVSAAKLPNGEVVTQAFSSISPFDPNRRFLFGYSNGAMLAHRLVSQMTDHWAALWAMSGTCGGKTTFKATPDSDHAVNLPQDGRYAVSFFAHHGDLDITVPPGDWGADDFDYQAPKFNDESYLINAVAGFPNALDYRPGYLPLSQASRGYRKYNHVKGQSPFRDRDGLDGPASARSKSWPDGENPDDHNPTVVVYRDSQMSHTNFTQDKDKRYFFEKDVWRFFNRHTRTFRVSSQPALADIPVLTE